MKLVDDQASKGPLLFENRRPDLGGLPQQVIFVPAAKDYITDVVNVKKVYKKK